MRAWAVACALWYGIVPWWLYEGACHYKGMSYGGHLWLNLRYAWTWLTFAETSADILFEMRVNGGGW